MVNPNPWQNPPRTATLLLYTFNLVCLSSALLSKGNSRSHHEAVACHSTIAVLANAQEILKNKEKKNEMLKEVCMWGGDAEIFSSECNLSLSVGAA